MAFFDRKKKYSSKTGFSLIEVLVTITLMALIMGVVLPNLSTVFRANLDGFARKNSNLFREARDYAILTQRVVKINFDLEKQEYWAEDAPPTFLLPSQKELEEIKDRKDSLDEDDNEKKKKKIKFTMTGSLTKKKLAVPSGLRIAGVLSPRSDKLIQEGIADIFYFPHGMAESAIVHLENREGEKRSLIINPLTGKTKLVPGFYFPSEGK